MFPFLKHRNAVIIINYLYCFYIGIGFMVSLSKEIEQSVWHEQYKIPNVLRVSFYKFR